MKIQTIGLGALVGGLLTVPMVAVMYLADKWLDLSFAPYDIFDWIARILPGPVVTFGIDLMIDSLETLGLNVAATAKTAEKYPGGANVRHRRNRGNRHRIWCCWTPACR